MNLSKAGLLKQVSERGAQVQRVAELGRDHVDGAGFVASTELLLPPAAVPQTAAPCSYAAVGQAFCTAAAIRGYSICDQGHAWYPLLGVPGHGVCITDVAMQAPACRACLWPMPTAFTLR